jgi:large subunit ribosomal protein L2|uniref:Ribosomal protein L2 n=1 Tax=Entomoneis sp. TaxID=186043 RepID=A0A3G1PWA9_9STRA|nr:ribosomal protein L2 [Entomoneis sp.]
MVLQTLKPTSPGKRHLIKLNEKNISKKPILKTKLKNKKINLGKNNTGKITIGHKSGGEKKRYREINFTNKNFIGIVFNIEYDPNRNAKIAAVFNFKSNTFFYVLAPKNLEIGNILKSGLEAEKKTGHTMNLEKIPVGCCIYNISSKPNSFAKISRAAGTYSVITEKTKQYAKILLSSGNKKLLSLKNFATIGVVSNELKLLTQTGKAGASRWLGKKPIVRGVAMNPVDHPHGGGEGRKSGTRKTPWGKQMGSRKK